MKVDYIEHWGTDLSPVNAARVSFANESKWEYANFNSEEEAYKFAEEVSGRVDYDYIYSDSWMGGYPVEHLSSKDAKLINYLAKHKHTSCFEHQGATLRLKVPIFIARQIQRHRTFAYNEVSRRYVDSAPEFFWPAHWRARAENIKQGSAGNLDGYIEHEETHGVDRGAQEIAEYAAVGCVNTYKRLLEGGVAPELARMILPQNLYTEFVMTGNLRNWAHFLKLRLDGHAQLEVRQIAQQVESLLRPLFPISVEALLKHE